MAVWSALTLDSLTDDFRLDPEYYRPDLLDLDKSLSSQSARPLGSLDGRFVVGPFGSAFNVENYTEEPTYRYVRGKDVNPFFLQDDDNVYVPKASFDALSKYSLKPFDIMISVVGTLGNCAIVPENIGNAIFSCKSTVWRFNEKNEELTLYLAAYLNCKVGQSLIQRMPRGHIQTGLNLDDLRSIPIPIPSSKDLKRISGMVRESQVSRAKAKQLISDAEKLLSVALGCEHLDLNYERCYTRRFSDLRSANRFGAEYFMPCKRRVLEALSKMLHRPLADVAPNVQVLWDPAQASRTEKVRNFDLTHALEPFLEDIPPQLAAAVGSTKKRMQNGDVVISRLRSYLREIAVVRTTDTVPTVGSSEFIVLRPKSGGISAETLMVYLRSPLVQTVLKWSQDGSNHPRFSADDLVAMPVPDAVLQAQSKIDALVKKSREKRSESLELLAQAKESVEDMITGPSSRKGR